ncbi:hypothetical protein CYMTET_25780, partial [Cymbomonas tetramitiformis]
GYGLATGSFITGGEFLYFTGGFNSLDGGNASFGRFVPASYSTPNNTYDAFITKISAAASTPSADTDGGGSSDPLIVASDAASYTIIATIVIVVCMAAGIAGWCYGMKQRPVSAHATDAHKPHEDGLESTQQTNPGMMNSARVAPLQPAAWDPAAQESVNKAAETSVAPPLPE